MVGKICPFSMSNNFTRVCVGDYCESWVPEQKIEYRCTLRRENSKDCPMDQVVSLPDHMVYFCDGCPHYEMFQIKPIPAHCKRLGNIYD